jgi:hypothetical protein
MLPRSLFKALAGIVGEAHVLTGEATRVRPGLDGVVPWAGGRRRSSWRYGGAGLGYGGRVEARREVLGWEPLPVSILLITSFETWTRTARSF